MKPLLVVVPFSGVGWVVGVRRRHNVAEHYNAHCRHDRALRRVVEQCAPAAEEHGKVGDGAVVAAGNGGGARSELMRVLGSGIEW
jgi:hypothetical protein